MQKNSEKELLLSSGSLIWNSIKQWDQNPIATTITTHPISQLAFPKIYICPPRKTYTNLNYDIVYSNNTKLTSSQIEQLEKLIDEKIQEAELEKIIEEYDYYEDNILEN